MATDKRSNRTTSMKCVYKIREFWRKHADAALFYQPRVDTQVINGIIEIQSDMLNGWPVRK